MALLILCSCKQNLFIISSVRQRLYKTASDVLLKLKVSFKIFFLARATATLQTTNPFITAFRFSEPGNFGSRRCGGTVYLQWKVRHMWQSGSKLKSRLLVAKAKLVYNLFHVNDTNAAIVSASNTNVEVSKSNVVLTSQLLWRSTETLINVIMCLSDRQNRHFNLFKYSPRDEGL